jgi:non-specific serine/threonine protein kinase
VTQARAWLQECLERRYESASFGIGPVLDRLAAVAAATSESERALRLSGAADMLYENLDARRTPAERLKVERWLAAPRAGLSADAAAAARAAGRALGLDGAVAFALEVGDTSQSVKTAAPTAAAALLSPREREVAVLVARGLSNPQIAEDLVISVHTAQRHVENILGKLGFSSRTQVAAWAVGQGLVGAPSADVHA